MEEAIRAALAEIDRLSAERADLLALLEVARRDTDGAELGAAREREECAALAETTGRLHPLFADQILQQEIARHIRARGPLLPPGPAEVEKARGDALAAENAELKEALAGMVDACVEAGLVGGGPVRLVRRALASARKVLGVGQ